MKHLLTLACVCALSSGCAQTPSNAGADRRRREGVSHHRQRDDPDAGHPAGTGGLGPADLHHRRLRSDRRARQPGVQRGGCEVRAGGGAIRHGAGVGRRASSAEPAESRAGAGDAVESGGVRRAVEDHGAARVELRQGQVVRRRVEARDLQEHRRCLADPVVARPTNRRCGRRGKAGTPSRRRCGRTISASSSCRTRAPRSSASPTPARCGAASTTCAPTSSPGSSIGCGIRCGRST